MLASPVLTWWEFVTSPGVSNGLCEHASSAFIFTSTSTDQFSHASSEHFRNYKWRAASSSSASWNLSLLKRCFAPSNLADTFKTGQQAQS